MRRLSWAVLTGLMVLSVVLAGCSKNQEYNVNINGNSNKVEVRCIPSDNK